MTTTESLSPKPNVGRQRMHQLGFDAEPMAYVDGMSLYEFVKDNPINLVDPWGLAATQPADPLKFNLPSGDLAHDGAPKSGEVRDSVVSQKELDKDSKDCRRVEVIFGAHRRLGTKIFKGTPDSDALEKILEFIIKKVIPGGDKAVQLAEALAHVSTIGRGVPTMYRATMYYQVRYIYTVEKDGKITPQRKNVPPTSLRFDWQQYDSGSSGIGIYGIELPDEKETWDNVQDAIKDVLDQVKGD